MPKLKDRGAPPEGDHRLQNRLRREARAEAASKAATAKTTAPPMGHVSGYCNDEAELRDLPIAVTPDDLHAKCKGGVTNEAGKFSPCVCPGHDSEFKCHQCLHIFPVSHEGDYDEDFRRCVDRTACAGRIAHASELYRKNSPLHQQIDQIHADIAAKTALEREAGKEALREAGRKSHQPRTDEQAMGAAVTFVERVGANPSSPPPPKRPAKFPQLCHEGCGEMTKGGRFIAGHDMRLKGRLFEVARSLDPAVERGPATDEIVARGWNEAGCDPALLIVARQMNPADVIRDSVRARYDDDTAEVA